MTLLCLCVVSASAAVFNYPGKFVQELTWEEVKDGNTAFVLASGDKMLYVPTGHDTRFDVVNAINDASNAVRFKIETLDNGYLFHAYNLAGESFELGYDWYKGPGYLNCQNNIGQITFTLAGTNEQHGQDMPNGAVWKVTPVDGGYTIQNVGNNGYLAGTVTSAEPTHIWKFYTAYQKGDTYEIENKEMAAGDYYVRHAATGKFLGGANDWGTRASLVNHGQVFTVVNLENGKYKLDSHTYNNATDHFLGADYVDNAGNELEFIEAENGVKIVNGTNFVKAVDGLVNTSVAVSPEDADVWRFITHDEMIAALANATEENPMDATFAVKAANFSRNLYNQASDPNPWIVENCTNKNLSGGNNVNNCAESFHSTFKIYQTIEGLPNGVYSVKAQGFYRKDDGDIAQLPVFFANDETAEFPVRTGTENSMGAASASFSEGKYTISPLFVKVTEGTLTLGVLNETQTNLWCIWDNFEVAYYGADADYERLKFGVLVDEVERLLAEAQALVTDLTYKKLDAEKRATLIYIADEANKPALKTEEDYKVYIASLKIAIEEAKKSEALYAQAKKRVTVFDGYAKSAGFTLSSIEAFNTVYNNGTLTGDPVSEISTEYEGNLWAMLQYAKNMTECIENSDFETNDMTGWEAKGLHTATNKNFGWLTGEIFVENWVPGPGKLNDDNFIKQTVSLPAGEYVLTAEAQFLQQGDASVVPGGFFIYAGDNMTEVSSEPATIAVPFSLTDASDIALGAKIQGATGNWASVDHFQLYKLKSLSVASTLFSATGAEISFDDDIYFLDDAESIAAEVLNATGEKVCDATIDYGSDTDYTLVKVTFSESLPDGSYQLVIPGNAIASDNDESLIFKGGSIKFTIGEDIPTFISGAESLSQKNGKFLQNGQIVIVKNGKAYNVMGIQK